jgi:hypothetical protein
MVLERDLGGVLDLLRLPPSTAARPAAAIAAAEPTSPWQPTSAPEIEALRLMSPPIAAAVSRKSSTPPGSRAGHVVEPVAQHRRARRPPRRWSGR